MYETMYYMYVYTVRTSVFLFIILYNYEDLNKGAKKLKKNKKKYQDTFLILYTKFEEKKNRHEI